MAPLDSRYTQVGFNLISVQVCAIYHFSFLLFLSRPRWRWLTRAILARVAAPDRDVGRRRGFSESRQEGVRHQARHRVRLRGEPVRRDLVHETWVRFVCVGNCAQWRWRLCSPLPRMGHRREIGGSRNAARTPIPVGRVVAVRCHRHRFYDLAILLPSDGMGEAENMVCAPVAAPRPRLPA